jgi:tetratricopeptide (TPR) repeat protein
MAAVRRDKLDAAQTYYQDLAALAADPVLQTQLVWDRYPLAHAAQVAERTLASELALARGDRSAAIAALREAVTIEDGIPYDEPPGWHAPSRLALGAALLADGKAKEAEAVYREELRRNPGNGWSLWGLAQSLDAQDRVDDAAAVRAELAQAWQHADLSLTASHF